jgi:hypothetical protein
VLHPNIAIAIGEPGFMMIHGVLIAMLAILITNHRSQALRLHRIEMEKRSLGLLDEANEAAASIYRQARSMCSTT